jgi:threonine/homoserine/homoserine lactone efflux protein
MPDLAHWSIFFTATIILLLIPGPSVIYVITRGIDQGYRGVVYSAVGLALGDLLQVLGTVVGLSALLATSTMLLTVLKYVGAAYLIFLGFRKLLDKNSLSSAFKSVNSEYHVQQTSSGSLVLQGFLTLNPKTALFFLALFPQFVSENAGPAWFQILLFGCAFVILGFVTNSMYGCLGGTLGSMVRRSNRFHIAARYLSAVSLIALGVAAAFTSAPHRPV